MIDLELQLTRQQQGFHDTFERFDHERWAISDGWANSLPFHNCWRGDHVHTAPGMLTLTLDDRPCREPGDCHGKPFASGEVQSRRFFQHGLFEARFRAARGSGLMAGSLFTYTGPEQGTAHHEIDVEILGRNTRQMQTNYFTDGVGGHETLIDLGFDAAEDFHTYAFEWQPDCIRWYVDGLLVHAEGGERGPLPSLPQKLMVNLWPGIGVDDWLGPFRYAGIPIHAHYTWIRYIPGTGS